MMECTQASALLESQGFEVLQDTHGGFIPGSWADGKALGITDGTLHAVREQGTGLRSLVFFPLSADAPMQLMAADILHLEIRGQAVNLAVEMTIKPSTGDLEVVTFLGPTQRMKPLLSALGAVAPSDLRASAPRRPRKLDLKRFWK